MAKLWLYLPFFAFYGFLKRCVRRKKQVKPYFGSQQPRHVGVVPVIKMRSCKVAPHRCVGFTDKLLKCSKTDQRPKTASLQSTVPSTLSSVLAPWLPSKPALVFSWPITTSFLGRLQYSTFARDLSSTGRWRRHPGVAFRSTTLCVAFSSSTIGNKHSQLPLMEMPRDGAGGGWAGPTLRPDLAPAKQSTTGPDVPCVTRHVLSVT